MHVSWTEMALEKTTCRVSGVSTAYVAHMFTYLCLLTCLLQWQACTPSMSMFRLSCCWQWVSCICKRGRYICSRLPHIAVFCSLSLCHTLCPGLQVFLHTNHCLTALLHSTIISSEACFMQWFMTECLRRQHLRESQSAFILILICVMVVSCTL